jgi:GAF domain-containing protein
MGGYSMSVRGLTSGTKVAAADVGEGAGRLSKTGARARELETGGVPSIGYRHALRAFADVTAALGEVLDLDALLHLIAKSICELVDVRRCSVYLRDDKTGLFHGRVGHADHDIDAGVKRLVAGTDADGFTREIVASKAPVVVVDALADPRPIRSTMKSWGVRSMLGVPMVLRGEVIGVVYLDNEEQPHTFGPDAREFASMFADLAAVAIAQAKMTTELRTTVGTVERQNELLRRATAVDDRLARLALQGGNLGEIAQAVADLSGKPCSIHDAGCGRLAGAAPSWFEEQVRPRLLDRRPSQHPSVREALAALDGASSTVIGPLPAAGLTRRHLVAPVTMRDDQWGYLVILESGTRFGPLDSHIASRAATNIALELAAERRAVEAEWDARASLASELIRGNRDGASLQRRAHYLGVDLDATRVLALITSDGTGTGALPAASEISTALAEAADDGTVIATGVAEGVVAILELPAGSPTLQGIAEVREAVREALTALGGVGGMCAALSSRCAELDDYVPAYTEARQVMACLENFAPEGGTRVVSADDLGPGRLFLASASRVDADRFAHDALGSLLTGEEDMCTLLGTLQTFFDCSRSLRRSATVLGVHENTIRYRLGRIERLTGLAVASKAEDQLTAQMTLLILSLEGRLPS